MDLRNKIYHYLRTMPGRIKSACEIQLRNRPNNIFLKQVLRYANKRLNLPPHHNTHCVSLRESIAATEDAIRRRSIRLETPPYEIEIGTTIVCNIDPPCVQCPKHSIARFGYIDKSARHMQRKYLDILAPFLSTANRISLHGFGEPLTCPYLFDTLRYAHQDAYIYFFTNGLLITDAVIDKIFRYNISTVNVSLDAASAETYFKIRHHDFSATLDKIRNLIAARDKAGRSIPTIAINMTLMRENIAEFPDFIRLARTLDAEVHIHRLSPGLDFTFDWFDYHAQHCHHDPQTYDTYIAQGLALAGELGVDVLYTGKKILSDPDDDTFVFHSRIIPKEQFFCSFPWKHLFIDTDGSVYNCCWQNRPIGHLDDTSLWNIWNGGMVTAVRETTAQGVPHTICNNASSSCPFVLNYLASYDTQQL